MAQKRISFEWYVGEANYEDWRTLIARLDAVDARASLLTDGEWKLLTRLLRGIVLLLVVAVAATGAALSPTELARLQARQGIQFSLALENKAWQTQDNTLFNSLIDDRIPNYWNTQWRDYWQGPDVTPANANVQLVDVTLIGNLAEATVLINQPAKQWWQVSPAHEIRFYRQTEQGWMRTLPSKGFWGQQQVLETDHLRFRYFAPDAAAVKSVAPRVEAAYLALYQYLYLAPPADSPKLTLNVIPDLSQRWTSAFDDQIDITSPLLNPISGGMTASDYLADNVFNWLAYRALYKVSYHRGTSLIYTWPTLTWAMRGWLEADLLGLDSPWRQQANAVFRRDSKAIFPLGLDSVRDFRTDARSSRDDVLWRYMAAESVVDYVVHTYGRDRLPDLIRGLSRYRRWETLIPAVYAMPMDQFVTDWNVYLAQHYGLANDAP